MLHVHQLIATTRKPPNLPDRQIFICGLQEVSAIGAHTPKLGYDTITSQTLKKSKL